MMSMLLALAAPSAWAWPADLAWIPLTEGGAPLQDAAGDHTAGDASLDLFGDAALPVALWYADDASMYLRMQVLGDPQSGSLLKPQTWGWLVEIDGDDVVDYIVASEGATGQLVVYENAGGSPGVQPGFANLALIDVYGTLASGEVRRALGSGATFFVDIQIPRSAIDLDLGIGPDDTVRLAPVTGPSVFFDWADVGRCLGPCTSALDALADAVQIDGDLDGWTDPQEAERGTDPLDADTDDDGLVDGLEGQGDADGDGLVDGLDCDADGDGLLDGTEAGLTTAALHPDTDLTVGCFVPDADPTGAATDPLAQDTDGGGLLDGVEDWNFDGEVDPWETDPTDPSDDVDSDGDGIADVLELQGPDGQVIDLDSDLDGIPDGVEGLRDHDGDTVPNFLDDDSDGDGLSDLDEGAEDTDGDSHPDFLDDDSDGDGIPDGIEGLDDTDGDGMPEVRDLDSDGDGIPDAVEGVEDADGDGTPDFRDEDSDDDGIPDAIEGAGDTDGDGTPDFRDEDSDDDGIPDAVEGADDTDGDGTPDFRDEDSDDDGIPDAVEGTGDEDCDGIPDYLDDDPEDSFCGTPTTPTVDTGAWDPSDPPDAPRPFTGGEFTGGACTTAPSGVVWLPTLLAGLFVRRRRRGVAAATLLAAAPASAQEAVNAQRFAPSVDGGPFVKIEDATPTGPLGSGGLGVWLDYADDPLVYRPTEGEEFGVLESVATTNLTGFVSLGRFGRVGADVPLHLYTAGFQIDRPVQLGDARLSGEGRLPTLDLADGLDTGILVDLVLPTGSGAAFVGAGTTGVRAAALGTLATGPLLASVNVGVRSGTGAEIGALTITPAVVWGMGAHVAVSDALGGSIELDGERWFGNPGLSGGAPVEWLGAAHLGAGRSQITLGAGSGLSRGIGSPDVRVIAGLTLRAGAVDAPTPVPSVDSPTATEPDKGWLVVRAMSPGGDPIGGAEVRVVGTLGTPLQTGRDGILEARVFTGPHEVTIAAEGWLAETRAIVLDPDETIDLTVIMRPAEEVVVDADAKRIFLQRKVFFEVDRAELKVESLQVLDRLVEVLLAQPEIAKIRVEGHTDVTGTDAHNLELSQQRAQAVVAYLARAGVDPARLEAKGLGESEPLQAGDSEDVHATNRRVEFHIVAITPQ